jgi:hypothetical protein
MADAKTRRIAVTPTEERILQEYRQQTAEQRAFNNALDCVLDCCIPHTPHPDITLNREGITAEFQRIRASVEAMRKPI